jgi:hypothetical protein
MKKKFREELKRVFGKFPEYYLKILLGEFSAKVGTEDIFKPTTRNESLQEISNDSGVRVINFAISKNLTAKGTTFPHHNIRKFIWTSDG